ncbi:MAG: undecaprenyl/decaprenyl-phosphate alpha-N-acetylglucosaminyl 1-phosphate transferase, partial [Clostridiales bacterium]|nr:undecaprenyl/decaprenyl-phosphate alpha-N-acetylglucosaminyl 1-phosphate transferase [Clostridiales bacterium]
MNMEVKIIGWAAAALLTALAISFTATPVVKALAQRVGAMDVPKDDRRMHERPIARMGGLAIFFGFMFSVLIFVPVTAPLRGLLLGAVIIVVLGVLDDIYSLPAAFKFAVQIIAALMAVQAGNVVEVVSKPNIFSSTPYWELGILSVPLTIIWIVA